VETWIPENGRAIQAATSHNLGQNFAKMFKIEFEDKDKSKKLVWQTSWGLTTRSLGILSMMHGDDKGLVLPPNVANIQFVIIPIIVKGKEQEVAAAAANVRECLLKPEGNANVRVHIDDRDNYTAGWKFNHWELKGVPVRVEIGPKEAESKKAVLVFRYSHEKR
jgi:prolyl-tRNA synthetase